MIPNRCTSKINMKICIATFDAHQAVPIANKVNAIKINEHISIIQSIVKHEKFQISKILCVEYYQITNWTNQ